MPQVVQAHERQACSRLVAEMEEALTSACLCAREPAWRTNLDLHCPLNPGLPVLTTAFIIFVKSAFAWGRKQFNVGMVSSEDPKNFISEGLADHVYIAEVENDLGKLLNPARGPASACDRDTSWSVPYLARLTGTTVLLKP